MKKIFVLLSFILCVFYLFSCNIEITKENTTNLKIVYFYGFFDEFVENDYKARILYDYNEIDCEISLPNKTLIPSDVLHLKHKGELIAQTSFPGRILLEQKNYIEATYSYTIVVEIDSSKIIGDVSLNSDKIIEGYNLKDQFVIINSDLDFISLSNFKGDKLYASLVLDDNNQPIMTEIAALFAYNPRMNN